MGRTARKLLCLLLVLLGMSVLLGWLFGIEALKSIIPGLSTMKFNAALCFVLVGLGLAGSTSPDKAGRQASAALGAVAAAIGAATLAQYIGRGDFGIDQLFVPDRGTLSGSGHPGRMSPLTATAWVALGTAVVLFARARRRRPLVLAHLLSAYAGFVAFLAAAGYAFGAEAFLGIGVYTAIALHTAIGLVAAAAAALLTRRDEGWLGGFADAPGARAVLLDLLPVAAALPTGVGFALLLGSLLGAWNAAFGFALFVPFMAIALVAVGIRVAGRVREGELALRESEGRLREALGELKSLNESLEQQVEQRTQEREAALAQLHEIQKMETLGQLTGGVAHDFNNLLTPMVGNLDLLRRRHEADARSSRWIDGALQAADRARLLVARLLAFARRQTLEPRPVDISALTDQMLDLLKRSLGPTIDVVLEAQPKPCFGLVDPNQLELAILNLAVNARDAMPSGGTLTISIAAAAVGEDRPRRLAPGDYVRIIVADTGAGMDEQTLARAVEPFFSTKGLGKGTGLGLSMVHGLCAQLGGALLLSSTPGTGTRAELWLPAADAAARPQALHTAEAAHAAGPLSLLLVDDEELVRAGIADSLSDLGYSIVEASSGEEALALLRNGTHVSAVITDYLMPRMNGGQLIAELSASYPALPVMLVTGFANAAGDIPETVPRLAKPFRQAELAQAVLQLLERSRGLKSVGAGQGG